MFGYVKEPDLEIVCFTTAGIWYDRVITKKGIETVWMKRETKRAREARLKEKNNARKMS